MLINIIENSDEWLSLKLLPYEEFKDIEGYVWEYI